MSSTDNPEVPAGHPATSNGPDFEAPLGTASTASEERRSEILGVAASGGINLAGAGFNQALRFVITLVIARLLGRADAGLYYQGFAFLALLGLLASGGFTLSMTRFVALHRADNDPGALRGTVRVGLFFCTATAILLGIALYVAAPWLAHSAFHDPELQSILRWVALALPPSVFTDVALSATQGYKTMRPYALVNLFYEPSARVILTMLLLGLGWGLSGVMAALLITNASSSILAAIALKRLMGPAEAAPLYNFRELFAFSGVGWLSNLANSGLIWADTILLGLFATPADVGVYQISARLVLLATIFIQPVTTSFAPRVTDLYRRGRYDTLQTVYALVTSWIVRLSLPAFILLLAFAHQLLRVFGPAFTVGATVTVLLSLGQMVNSTTGPCGYMLSMSGRVRLQMVTNIAALVFNVGLNLWLIPRYGLVGAAVAWALAIAGFNIVRVVAVKLVLGMLPLSMGLVKGLVAGLITFGLALLMRGWVHGLIQLALAALVLVSIYAVLIRFLGLDDDDRLILRTLWGRVSRRKLATT